MNNIEVVKNGQVLIKEDKARKIRGYHKNKNSIDLDACLNNTTIDVKYNGVILPMHIRDIELESSDYSRRT